MYNSLVFLYEAFVGYWMSSENIARAAKPAFRTLEDLLQVPSRGGQCNIGKIKKIWMFVSLQDDLNLQKPSYDVRF